MEPTRHVAELSSIASQLSAMLERLEDIALTQQSGEERASGPTPLLEVERQLRGALRELERVRRL